LQIQLPGPEGQAVPCSSTVVVGIADRTIMVDPRYWYIW
jgi:hypothetical protein